MNLYLGSSGSRIGVVYISDLILSIACTRCHQGLVLIDLPPVGYQVNRQVAKRLGRSVIGKVRTIAGLIVTCWRSHYGEGIISNISTCV